MYLEEHCAQRSKRAGEGAKASGLCRSVDGNLPWSPGTIDEATMPSFTPTIATLLPPMLEIGSTQGAADGPDPKVHQCQPQGGGQS